MTTKKYRYDGPASGVELPELNDGLLLWPGKEYSLPESNEWVKTQVAQKILVPLETDQAKGKSDQAKVKTAPKKEDK